MKSRNTKQMLLKDWRKTFRKNGRAILRALAISHGYRARCEIDVLDPKAHTFVYAQPGTVHQLSHYACSAFHVGKHLLDFAYGQYDRYAMSALNSLQSPHLAQRLAEHGLIEKDHRVERLGLCGSRDMTLDSQVVQELLDLRGTHLRRVAPIMKENVLAYPITVCFCRTRAEVPPSANGDELIKKARGLLSVLLTP